MKETEIPADEGIHFDGFVEDPSVFFREKGIFLSPVYSGSGVRIKIMEAMSVGTPVITTTLGATGITNDNETIIIADTDQQLIEKAILLYEDRDLREKLGKNSTAFIRENFSRGAVSKKLRNVLEAKEA
jgi:glycosyltransferase involved in cell wall biosynthesis